MTRGKIIYIDENNAIHYSCEFNGDMYPEGKGEQIIEKFQEGYFRSLADYKMYVERFNRRNFGYDNVFGNIQELACNELSIDNNYTDYLYIINGSERGFLLTKTGEKYVIPVGGMAIVNFQEIQEIKSLEQVPKGCEQMLTKDEFVSYINNLRETSDLVKKVNDLYRKSRNNTVFDFGSAASLQISHETLVIKLLEKVMNDKHENIEYFIYGLDYGRKYEDGVVTDENEEDIDMRSAEKLYEYLSQNTF